MRLSGTYARSISSSRGLGNQLWDLAGNRPSLDLPFAESKSLVDATTGTNLIDFTRASSGTYVGSDGLIKTATTNEPRFDHDPTTGESLGLLVEEQRTNLLLYSTNFDNSYWLQTHITTNTVTGPDGTTTAATYEGTGTGASSVYNTTNATVSASTQYTYSIYIKLGTMSANDYKFAVYDVSNNSFVEADLVPTVTPTTTNWTRISYTFTTPVGCTQIRVYPFRNSAPIILSTVHFWGAQLEEGSFPTSYIPTEGSTVTRAADVASITGTNFSSWYRQDEGSFYVKAVPSVSSAIATADNGSLVSRKPQISVGSFSEVTSSYVENGTVLASLNTGITSTIFSHATAYADNDYAAARDGANVVVDTSGALPGSVTTLRLGRLSNGAAPMNSTIRRITYWPTRLPNETLQTITQ